MTLAPTHGCVKMVVLVKDLDKLEDFDTPTAEALLDTRPIPS